VADTMLQANSQIDQLTRHAREIGAITESIDDLASQTNLLALNAAIEAARAGAQGKGFAVVAGEVRKLAARSATAAKEIASLIRTVQDDSAAAAQAMQAVLAQMQSDHSAQALQNIVVTMKEENTAATQRVSQAAREVDTQIIQVAASAESLAQMAADLQATLAHFALAAATADTRYRLTEGAPANS